MGAPDILPEFKDISTDQNELISLLVSVSNFCKQRDFSLSFCYYVLDLFLFPQKFQIFPVLLLVFRTFWKNVSITPALPQSQQTTSLASITSTSRLSIHFKGGTTLRTTFKTLTIIPLETPPPPPNALIYGSSFTIFIHRITFNLLPNHSLLQQ